jgi:hypothetical protein
VKPNSHLINEVQHVKYLIKIRSDWKQSSNSGRLTLIPF